MPPTKPYKQGKIHKEPATSPLEVLERTRDAISPRGSWYSGGRNSPGSVGHKRCLIQFIEDCDGKHVKAAEKLVLAQVKTLFPSFPSSTIPSFNDHNKTTKIHIIQVLDAAIEKERNRLA